MEEGAFRTGRAVEGAGAGADAGAGRTETQDGGPVPAKSGAIRFLG